jgi:hypothetical protein
MSYRFRTRTTVTALATLAIVNASASAQIFVTSPSLQERIAHAGEEYAGTIDVRNTSATAQKVSVRVVDYSFQADGSNRYDDAGTRPRSNATWLTLSARTLEVPPLQQATLAYVVRVPHADSLRGSYSSMVLVTGISRDEPIAGGNRGRANAGLHSRLSFGVQLATHLSGPAVSQFAMENVVLSAPASHERTLSLTLRNTGERAQRPMMSLELYRADGQLVASQKSQRGLIYPGSSVRQQFVLTGIPSGTYRALIQADAGGDDLYALQSDVRF